MKWYEIHVLRKLKKDLVVVNWTNRKTIKRLKKSGYVKSFGIVPKGKYKGKECVQLLPNGEEYLQSIRNEKKEKRATRHFWIGIIKDIVIFFAGLVAEEKFGIIDSIVSRLFH